MPRVLETGLPVPGWRVPPAADLSGKGGTFRRGPSALSGGQRELEPDARRRGWRGRASGKAEPWWSEVQFFPRGSGRGCPWEARPRLSLTCSSPEPPGGRVASSSSSRAPAGRTRAGPGWEQPAGPLGSHGHLLSLGWGICHPSLLAPHPRFHHASSAPSMAICSPRSPVSFVPSTAPGRGSVACWEESTDGRMPSDTGGAGCICPRVWAQIKLGPSQPNTEELMLPVLLTSVLLPTSHGANVPSPEVARARPRRLRPGGFGLISSRL